MSRLYRDLCDIVNAIPNSNFTTDFDPTTTKFSLVENNSTNITPNMSAPASPSNKTATTHDDELVEKSNGQHSEDNMVSSEDQGGDPGELDAVSSDGEDMAGYESDTSGSSSSSSSGEDVVVEGYGDSEGEGEGEGEEQLTEEEVAIIDEDEALVTANIQHLKVSMHVYVYIMYMYIAAPRVALDTLYAYQISHG